MTRPRSAEIPSYVPGAKPTVPGHEACVRVVAAGSKVPQWQPGQRYLVQADYRWILTAGANAAFGYNFEGALQEYVLIDARIIIAPNGDSTLLPAPEHLSASSVALVEPWACVEDAYAERQRRTVKPDGKLLAVSETPARWRRLNGLFETYGQPTSSPSLPRKRCAELPDVSFDDIVYFGANAETVEALFPKLAPHGLMNLVLCGERFARPVSTPVGRAHYHALRLIGTTGDDPAASMAASRKARRFATATASRSSAPGGPMGVMHVLRTLSLGQPGVSVYAADLDDARLDNLRPLAADVVAKTGASFTAYNPTRETVAATFSYLVRSWPRSRSSSPQAVATAGPGALINVFAGIPVPVHADLDLNAYVEKKPLSSWARAVRRWRT